MQNFKPLRDIPAKPVYGPKDVLVVFGEVFARGYVNGLIDEAKKAGMKVIYSTVGRRDETERLRPLNAEELAAKDQPLINVPLECGFDLVKSSKGFSPVDQLKGLKLSEAESARLDWGQVEESRRFGREDFRRRVGLYLKELEPMIPAGANVLVAHTMAGGVPRAKIILPVMNRVFKGHGDRYASSKIFWESTLGRFCEQSFMDVTANSLADLIELSSGLREKVKSSGGRVSYVAYGYHGTEILMGDEYRWQSYAPYLQGFAKLELERIATRAMADGVPTCVFNAPEILTNSSSIFLGVEVALYPLLGAFKRESPSGAATKKIIAACEDLLKPEHSVDEILKLTDRYFRSDIILNRWSDYPAWPQHNGPEQMELMRTTSDKIVDMHKDEKHLLVAELSELVFKACGRAMLCEGYAPRSPVWWVNHDLVARLSSH
ncbi:MAG TPA: hypothetical protein PKC28_11255 [Bdellovibrionales bacterium]|nr:hypothetical protein [Bdellovibrionales bacterium]